MGVRSTIFGRVLLKQSGKKGYIKVRPGAPCTKKFLVSNTEFTATPICTASRQYQSAKLKELDGLDLDGEEFTRRYAEITEKLCLCEGLAASAYISLGTQRPKENLDVAICPGPNLAYFKEQYSLKKMVDHIYGRIDLLLGVERPHMFLNELRLYIEHLRKYLDIHRADMSEKKTVYVSKFRQQLLAGIQYYKELSLEKFLSDRLGSGFCNACKAGKGHGTSLSIRSEFYRFFYFWLGCLSVITLISFSRDTICFSSDEIVFSRERYGLLLCCKGKLKHFNQCVVDLIDDYGFFIYLCFISRSRTLDRFSLCSFDMTGVVRLSRVSGRVGEPTDYRGVAGLPLRYSR